MEKPLEEFLDGFQIGETIDLLSLPFEVQVQVLGIPFASWMRRNELRKQGHPAPRVGRIIRLDKVKGIVDVDFS